MARGTLPVPRHGLGGSAFSFEVIENATHLAIVHLCEVDVELPDGVEILDRHQCYDLVCFAPQLLERMWWPHPQVTTMNDARAAFLANLEACRAEVQILDYYFGHAMFDHMDIDSLDWSDVHELGELRQTLEDMRQGVLSQDEDTKARQGAPTEDIPLVAAALKRFDRRAEGREDPDGKRDEMGRWFPSAREEMPCCADVRAPTRAYPWSLHFHALTLGHVAMLEGVQAGALRSALVRRAAGIRGEEGVSQADRKIRWPNLRAWTRRRTA